MSFARPQEVPIKDAIALLIFSVLNPDRVLLLMLALAVLSGLDERVLANMASAFIDTSASESAETSSASDKDSGLVSDLVDFDKSFPESVSCISPEEDESLDS